MTATIHTIGSILDHGSRSDVVLSEDIISFAQAHGFDAGEDYSGHNPRFIYAEDEDRAEMLSDLSETAIDFLNELDLPPYTYYGNDGEAGAFGLWPNNDIRTMHRQLLTVRVAFCATKATGSSCL